MKKLNKLRYYPPKIKTKLIGKITFFKSRLYDSYDGLLNTEGVLLAQSCGFICCFLADTKILMADGQAKPIKSIKAGDVVLSYNLNNHKFTKNKVVKKFVHPDTDDGYMIINNKLKVTKSHPCYVNNALWKSAGKISLEDYLFGVKSQQVPVTKIEYVTGSFTTYNLSLAGKDHNFFADGILVHNSTIAYGDKD